MKRKIVFVLLAALLALSVAACSKSNNELKAPTDSNGSVLSGDDLAFYKFPKPVDVHIGMSVDPTDKTLPANPAKANR